MKGIQKSWDSKLQYISKILNSLQDEVANAPAPVSPDDEDTYTGLTIHHSFYVSYVYCAY